MKKNSLLVFSFIGCFCSLLVAQKQENNLMYLPKNQYFKSIYSSNSDVSYFCPLGEMGAPYYYIFSSEMNPNFFITEPKKKPYALCLTPSILIRMRSNRNPGDRSFAVRTPSYRVKIRSFYALQPTKLNQYHYLEGEYVHHSNGQDGFVLQPNGQINTLTGSFSTNYAQLSYNSGKIEGLKHQFWTIGLEWHPWFVYHDVALLENYGFSRIHYDWMFKQSKTYSETENNKTTYGFTERWRLQWKNSYAMNKLKGSTLGDWRRRLNTEIIFNYLPKVESNAGFYLAAGYYGEDPYNIFFLDKYPFVRVGFCTIPFTGR